MSDVISRITLLERHGLGLLFRSVEVVNGWDEVVRYETGLARCSQSDAGDAAVGRCRFVMRCPLKH